METIKPTTAVNKAKTRSKKNLADIEEAKITSETEKKDDNGSEEKSNVKFTETINLKENKEDTDNHKVNFMDDSAMEDMLANEKEPSPEENKAEEKETKEDKPEDKKDSVQPVSDPGAFTKDDMFDFAEVFMDIIDMGISTALKFYSGDTSTYAYELGADKKRRLVRQLTNLFMKYQTKFSLEFMFIITLAICYSVPISKARKAKFEIKAGTFKRESGKPSR